MTNGFHPESHEAQQEAFVAHVIAEAGRIGMTLADLVERLAPPAESLTAAEAAQEAANRG